MLAGEQPAISLDHLRAAAAETGEQIGEQELRVGEHCCIVVELLTSVGSAHCCVQHAATAHTAVREDADPLSSEKEFDEGPQHCGSLRLTPSFRLSAHSPNLLLCTAVPPRVQLMLEVADRDGSDDVDLEEFYLMMRKSGAITSLQ